VGGYMSKIKQAEFFDASTDNTMGRWETNYGQFSGSPSPSVRNTTIIRSVSVLILPPMNSCLLIFC
jgi:hypothetical protein